MIYTSREKLTCFVMQDDDDDEVSFHVLGSLLMERPSNIIYCEKDGKLYGIISMGDIARAYEDGKASVTVNKRFMNVKPDGYMHARQIFKDNERINALPVVNNLHELLGDYSRWDDYAAVYDFGFLNSNRYAIDFCGKSRKYVFVRPCKAFVKKQELMRIWENNLLQLGLCVSVIEREDVMESFALADYILYTDEDELRGTGTLYKNIYDREFHWKKAKTYARIENEIENEIKDAIRDKIGDQTSGTVLKNLLSSGVSVFTLSYEDNESDYCQKLQKDIADKYSKIGKQACAELYEELREDFFAELYNEEYVRKILNHKYAVIHKDGISKLKDSDMETYKVTNGERRTLAQPPDFQRCIYFYGPCFIYGHFVADEYTIESFLQAKLNRKGYKAKCVNYGCLAEEPLMLLSKVVSNRLNKGDIVIYYRDNKTYEGIPNINIADICEKHEIPAAWMLDDPRHSNHKMNYLFADEIFEMIEPIIQKDIVGKEPVEVKNDFITLEYLDRYFSDCQIIHGGV